MSGIFIEGVCGVGKSTIMNELAKRLPALTLPELPEFNRSLLSSFTCEENIKNNFLCYVKHEAIRESVFFCQQINDINYVIADRSYLSIVALALSMRDYIGEEFVGVIISKVIKCIENSNYYTPDKVIVLYASYSNIYQRNIDKAKKMDNIWIDEERINPQMEFYHYLINNQLAVPVSTDQQLHNSLEDCIKECQHIQKALTKEDIINGLQLYKRLYI